MFARRNVCLYQQLRFGVFREGVFQKMPAFGGAISERNFCEICRRKSAQNTEKHKTKLCAEVPERPLLGDPFFRLLAVVGVARGWQKWPPNPIFQPFSGNFSHFSALFSPSPQVRRKSIFRPFFPDFGPKARRQSVAGQRDLNVTTVWNEFSQSQHL